MRKDHFGASSFGLVVVSIFLSMIPTSTVAQESVMGTCTWTKGNSQPRKQSCTMQHFNSGMLTITTYKKNYIFEPYSSRGGYKHFNRIFQLHGDLSPKVIEKLHLASLASKPEKRLRSLSSTLRIHKRELLSTSIKRLVFKESAIDSAIPAGEHRRLQTNDQERIHQG